MYDTEKKDFLPRSILLGRYFIYTIALFLFFLIVARWSKNHSVHFFRENGCFEWLQFALLCASAVMLWIGRRLCPNSRHVLTMTASVAAFAAGRELDKILNGLIPVIGWKFVVLFPLAAVLYCWRARQESKQELLHFAGSYPFALMWAAFIVAVPLAQLVGDGTFLQSLLQDDYNRVYKTIFEEACEGAGYLLLLFACFESVLFLRKHPPRLALDSDKSQPAAQSSQEGNH